MSEQRRTKDHRQTSNGCDARFARLVGAEQVARSNRGSDAHAQRHHERQAADGQKQRLSCECRRRDEARQDDVDLEAPPARVASVSGNEVEVSLECVAGPAHRIVPFGAEHRNAGDTETQELEPAFEGVPRPAAPRGLVHAADENVRRQHEAQRNVRDCQRDRCSNEAGSEWYDA